MKVTQTDIANHLNISRLTVSKALNNEYGVSDHTRKLVLRAAEELGYNKLRKKQMGLSHQGIQKRNRRGSRSHKQISLFLNLGLDSDSYWAPVIRGLTTILSAYGYNLNLCFLTTANGEHVDFPMNFQADETDGIIQFGNFKRHQIDQLMNTGLPMVSIDKTMDGGESDLFCDTIMNINMDPMARMVKHLVECGYKRIGYACEKVSQLTMHERWLGYLQGMKEAGLEINARDCFFGEFSEIINQIEAERRLDHLADFPDAIMCYNDMQAIAFMQYFQKHHIKIPDMIALTGCDNVSQSAVADLTTVNVNKEELGMCAAELILWRIENPDRPYRMVRLYDYELIMRGTTKCLTSGP